MLFRTDTDRKRDSPDPQKVADMAPLKENTNLGSVFDNRF